MQQSVTDAPAPARTSVALVRAEGLVKTFGSTRAVRGATFAIGPGEIHALCGHNGAGKSTVVKMLSGQETPDEGQIVLGEEPLELRSRQVAQRHGVALVDLELSVVPSLTVAENLMLGDLRIGWVNRKRQSSRRFRDLLDSVGLVHVRLDQRLSELSVGERQLVEIARAVGQDARLVILDEPTATLSDVESAYVYAAVRRIAETGCAVLFVSHRLGEVLELCDRITVMRDGEVVSTSAAHELTIDTLIHQMLGETAQRADARVVPDSTREVVLSVDRLFLPGRVDDFSLSTRAGLVYALAGQLGSGASEVLRAVAGLLPAASFDLTVDGVRVRTGHPVAAARAGIAFVSSDRKSEGLFLDRPVSWNLLSTRLSEVTRTGVISRRRWSDVLSRLVEVCGLDRARVGQSVSSLSGGNQQKVFVGRSLGREDVRVLLLDEPTRGVDVGGRAAIHALLREAASAGIAVLVSSTELEELHDLADVVVTMHKGKVVRSHQGAISSATLLREMTHGRTDEPVAGDGLEQGRKQ
jgi:ribose transport system ATP-binding protein/rhamnose transport system ATP-binding protein